MRSKRTMAVATAAVALGSLGAAGLADGASDSNLKPIAYGLTGGGALIKFDPTNTARARRVGAITGLASGERLVGLDIRQPLGDMYGLGDKSNLYVINTRSARATLRSSLKTEGGAPVGLQGTRFGIDFNPTNGRLRAIGDTGQNLRIDADTGITTADRALAYPGGGQPRAVGAAYSNADADSFVTPPLVPAGRQATGTTLYTIDAARNSLAIQDPPNDGTLKTVGRLRKRSGPAVGFDIYSQANSQGNTRSNQAYASFNPGGRARLYRVNLRTGKAKRIRGHGGPFRGVVDIALVP